MMPKPLVEVEQLFQVWEITEWRGDAVYRTVLAGTKWLTEDERAANHPAESNITYSPMPTSYSGQTIRIRKS